jgi:hypothetical protein
LDEVRIWANEIGAMYFHLAGRLGAEEDSLVRFKARFYDTVHPFNVLQLVVMNEEHMNICKKMEPWNESMNIRPTDSNYFPCYRGPIR